MAMRARCTATSTASAVSGSSRHADAQVHLTSASNPAVVQPDSSAASVKSKLHLWYTALSQLAALATATRQNDFAASVRASKPLRTRTENTGQRCDRAEHALENVRPSFEWPFPMAREVNYLDGGQIRMRALVLFCTGRRYAEGFSQRRNASASWSNLFQVSSPGVFTAKFCLCP